MRTLEEAMFIPAISLKLRRFNAPRRAIRENHDEAPADIKEDAKWARLLERIRRYEYPIADNAA
ncbi:MAG: hypothetical protein GC153_12325 [Alphaproteobacteria bacterium]|nr:hypothetical protein [Alphaproteobacteria bacterium]